MCFLCLCRPNINIYIKKSIFVSMSHTTVGSLHTIHRLHYYHYLRVTCCSLVCDPCPSSLSGHSWHIQYIDTKKGRGKAQTFGLSVSTGQASVRVWHRNVRQDTTPGNYRQQCFPKELRKN